MADLLGPQSRILVAGHSGLIGSAFVRRLEADGFANVITWPHRDLDLRRADDVMQAFEQTRPEFVVLAAGRVGGIVENLRAPGEFIADNLAIQGNTMRAARAINVRKMLVFGSSCMYPRECGQPMAEEALLTGMPEPTSLPYAIAKLAGVQMALAYNRQDATQRFLPVIPNSAYGPNDNFNPDSGHVLSALMTRFHAAAGRGDAAITLWGSGRPRREFVHADDIADAGLCLLSRDVSSLTFPVNIGVGEDISIAELAEIMAGLTGFKGRLDWDRSKPDGAPRKLLDAARLRAFGWAPRISPKEGLRMTYEWFLRHVAGPVQVGS